ncbi:hypothetical protein ES703_00055 [subsurface metagenome]
MYRGMKSPECTICHTPLEHTPQGWKCPVDGFYFNVKRGKAGPPLLRPVEAAGPPPPEKVKQPVAETFEAWRVRYGVTDEMYKDLDEKTRWEIKMAFSQRHLKDPDFGMLPPQR